jgi:hypothetical protein
VTVTTFILPQPSAESSAVVEVPKNRLPGMPTDEELAKTLRSLEAKAEQYHRARARTVRPGRKVSR